MDMLTPLTGETEKLKILELGPWMDPQAWLLWDEKDIEYFDVPENKLFYEGKMEIHEIYKEKYDWCKKFYKGRTVHFGNAARLNQFVDEKYDIIFASHILEHFPWYETDSVIASWVDRLKPGGALHVLVPAAEWGAEEILKDKPHELLMPYLHGGQRDEYDIHLTSFTMRYLRARLEQAGLTVTKAVTGPKNIRVGGQEVIAQQHYCVGFLITDEIEFPPPDKE